ncbi:MAG: hypothetical protein ACOCWL_02280 [Thermoguttaceae bacterium]
MKRTGHARRRARAASSPGLSMFPFLAVLICTIGSLVVLLVVITRQARTQAAIAAAEAAAEAQREAEAEAEMAEWRIEQLHSSHEKTLEQVADLRDVLGHLEDQARTLEAQLRQLKRAWETLEQEPDASRKAALEAELDRVRGEIRTAEQALADAQRQAAERPPSYAVVPYQGPNETRRRPMYIECRSEQIVLQPEGITLRPDDFDGPDGPGNPLAAALRAKREYLLAYGDLDPRTAGEPYPLLIVRPNGIGAYYAARNAMNSWGSEFGYELVESGWQIEFPQPNPQLAEMLRRAVEAARVRQEQLAAAAPRHYGSQRSQVMYRAAPGGGITVDGPSREPVRPAPRYGRPGGTAARPGTDAGEGFGRGTGASGGSTAGQGQDRSGGTAYGRSGGETPRAGEADSARTDAGWAVTERNARAGGAPSGAAAQAQATGSGAMRNPNGAAAADAGGTPLQLGEYRDPDTLRPLADKKGRDWALPNASARATPITRAVRIECHPDRLVLPARAGPAGGRTIALGERTRDSVDDLVAAVWDVIDRWGIAGRDLYWSPVLEVRVAPGAEARFNELQVLLEGSGFALERYEP